MQLASIWKYKNIVLYIQNIVLYKIYDFFFFFLHLNVKFSEESCQVSSF